MTCFDYCDVRFGHGLTLYIFLGCSFIAGTNSFRTAWAIQFIPCVFLLAGLPFLPRSPRWLAKVGRVDEAIEILARIQVGGNVNDPLVVAEWEEITTILAAERGDYPCDLGSALFYRVCLPMPSELRSLPSSFNRYPSQETALTIHVQQPVNKAGAASFRTACGSAHLRVCRCKHGNNFQVPM